MERIGLIMLCILAIYLLTEKIVKEFSDWEKDFSKECKLKEEKFFLKREYLKYLSGHVERRKITKQLLIENHFKNKELKKIIKEKKWKTQY
ncbi:hypothetical protein AB4370_21980 [Vibrio cyclitrophicus]